MENLRPQEHAAYISQYNFHVPEMTVRETIDFSARCQGVESRKGNLLFLSTEIYYNYQLYRFSFVLQISVNTNKSASFCRTLGGSQQKREAGRIYS